MDNSPVLILGYARTKHILDTLNFLTSLGKRRVYLSLDAPANLQVFESQNHLLSEISLKNYTKYLDLKIRRNKVNQGVAVSVISGLDWFFTEEAFGIVLEDDLVFSHEFIKWCEWARCHFESDPEVFMISGNRFNGESSMSYCHYPQTWGWATWRTRWKLFRPFYTGKKIGIHNIFSYKSNFWTGGTLRILSAVTDTWDIAVAKFMFENSLLTVLPPANLVSNHGADSFSTHTKLNVFPVGVPISLLPETSLTVLPKISEEIAINDKFLEEMVFKIHWKHWLSLPKNLYLIPFRHRLNNKLSLNETVFFEE